MFAPLPSSAAWRQHDARTGFEVACFRDGERGVVAEGVVTAVEDDSPWAIEYRLRVDEGWHTRSAQITARYPGARRALTLQSDGLGRWQIDGVTAPELDGCLDVDLAASAFTNALPVHRLALPVGEGADTPAVYVATDLTVSRLDQHYRRLADGTAQRYDYASRRFDFRATLDFDESGLIANYPGLATRTA
ncbi:putative glycolipid-binding domain-containing protein [Nocardia sp. AG03]|uniref:putative glycolipid-binding domain-containing protein n=1 Tax=Nocardia sp. AG03 TaxID=3025312 RepID=UPI0024186766|nr:putative glycolipid-binding domain-containing protein [Nocardia sp. AG03]